MARNCCGGCRGFASIIAHAELHFLGQSSLSSVVLTGIADTKTQKCHSDPLYKAQDERLAGKSGNSIERTPGQRVITMGVLWQVNLWGLDAIKTKGESVAVVLYMVGAWPLREGTGRIARCVALLPLSSILQLMVTIWSCP